ncbi:MAG: alpha/beta hydrolase [Planctomycetota bacterium]|nr:MAG: alpha/beta hydrolase [Planctomycetota bacterium]
MPTSILTCCVLLCWAAVPAAVRAQPLDPARPQVVKLWDGPAPGAAGDTPQDIPTAWLYAASAVPDAGARAPVLVIFPGGGYGGLAIDHEGHAIARWANSLGMMAVIVEYRHRGRGYGHPAPMLDAQRAIRYVRHHADVWQIDPQRVGVIGFSAGGHLATTVLTKFDAGNPGSPDPIERESCRPDFGIACYPVVALGEAFTHRGSQRNLLGDEAPADLVRLMSNEKQVRPDSPPCFLWHTADDAVVSVENSLRFASSLSAAGVPFELHVFPHGRHGLGLAQGHPGVDQWPDLCQNWLVRLGMIAE